MYLLSYLYWNVRLWMACILNVSKSSKSFWVKGNTKSNFVSSNQRVPIFCYGFDLSKARMRTNLFFWLKPYPTYFAISIATPFGMSYLTLTLERIICLRPFASQLISGRSCFFLFWVNFISRLIISTTSFFLSLSKRWWWWWAKYSKVGESCRLAQWPNNMTQ